MILILLVYSFNNQHKIQGFYSISTFFRITKKLPQREGQARGNYGNSKVHHHLQRRRHRRCYRRVIDAVLYHEETKL